MRSLNVLSLISSYWSNGKKRPQFDDEPQVRFNKLVDRVEDTGSHTWDEYDPDEVRYGPLDDDMRYGYPPPPPKEYDPRPDHLKFRQQSYRDGREHYGIRTIEPFPQQKREVVPMDDWGRYEVESEPVVKWEEPEEEIVQAEVADRRGSLRDYMGPRESEPQLLVFGGVPVNTVILGMQLAASFALILVFIFNHYLNNDFAKQLAAFSPYADHSPVTAAILGAITGFFLCYFPPLEFRFKKMLVMFAIGIILLFFLIGPVFVYFITGSFQDFALSLREVTLGFLKIIAVIVYWFPMIIGIYGIWTKKQWCIGVAAFFLLLIIVAVDVYLEVEGLPSDKGSSFIASYILFGLLLLVFIELGDTMVRFTEFPMTPYTIDEKGNHTPHLERIISNYFLFFIMFACLAVVASIFVFRFDSLIRLIGSERMANSLEVNSIFGVVISLMILVLVIAVLIGLFREEKRIRAGLKRMWEYRTPFTKRKEEEEKRKERVSFLVEEHPEEGRVVD